MNISINPLLLHGWKQPHIPSSSEFRRGGGIIGKIGYLWKKKFKQTIKKDYEKFCKVLFILLWSLNITREYFVRLSDTIAGYTPIYHVYRRSTRERKQKRPMSSQTYLPYSWRSGTPGNLCTCGLQDIKYVLYIYIYILVSLCCKCCIW